MTIKTVKKIIAVALVVSMTTGCAGWSKMSTGQKVGSVLLTAVAIAAVVAGAKYVANNSGSSGGSSYSGYSAPKAYHYTASATDGSVVDNSTSVTIQDGYIWMQDSDGNSHQGHIVTSWGGKYDKTIVFNNQNGERIQLSNFR